MFSSDLLDAKKAAGMAQKSNVVSENTGFPTN